MIAALIGLAVPLALALSLVVACAVAVRGFAAPSRAEVGVPPAGARAETLRGRGGVALAAWFAPGQPGCGAVVLLHGLRSDRRALAARLQMLARRGLAVLAVDLRAHGESGGRAVTFGAREAEDAVDALAWLRAAAPGERVGGLGISLGGAALLLASREAAFDALVLESVFPDLTVAIRRRLRLVAGRAEPWLTPVFAAVGAGLTGIAPASLRPIEAMASYAGPVLVIGGGADPLTPPSDTEALFAAAPGRKELWIVAGAGHADMAVAAGSDYEGRVAGFLNRTLQQMVTCA